MGNGKKKMKRKLKMKLIVDILMTLTLFFLMGYQLWGETAHEWAGAFMLVIFIVHHVLNAAWYRNLFRGKYTGIRILLSAVDLVLLAVMVCLMVSGIIMSRHAFAFLPISGGMGTARLVHMAACYWGFVLMAFHVGLHWGMVLARFRQIFGTEKSSGIRCTVIRISGVLIAGYGLYVFVTRDMATYMFLRTQFVFLDYSESLISFYIDYLAMMGLFIWIAHYLSVMLQRAGRKIPSAKKKTVYKGYSSMEILRREIIYIWYYFSIQLEQVFFYWALGMVIGSAISVFGKGKIHGTFQALGRKKLGILGLIPASLLGIASPLCMYGTIPIAASFSQKGMKDDMLAAFMMSSILLNPQLLITSGILGPEAVTVRFLSAFLTGIGAGLCVRFFYRDRSYFNLTGFSARKSRDTDPNPAMRFLKNLGRNIRATVPWFLAGVLLSALFQRYVPAEEFARIFGEQEGFGVLLAATIGVPLYACGGGTVPLLQQWLSTGMSMGAAAAFMITGPATKITNLGALKIVLGAKRFILYLLYVILTSLVIGVAVDWVL